MLRSLCIRCQSYFPPWPIPIRHTQRLLLPLLIFCWTDSAQQGLAEPFTVAISHNRESQERARRSLHPGAPCPVAALHSWGVMPTACPAASSVPGPPAARICCTITLAHFFLPWQNRPELNFSIETGKQRLCFFPCNKV